MILAVDPGLATCGWAVVERFTGIVVDIGLIETTPDDKLGVQADRIARIRTQADALRRVLVKHDEIDTIAAEALSFNPRGRVSAVASLCLSWGALAALSVEMEQHALVPNERLVDVTPKQWQHGVTGKTCKVEYSEVFDMLHAYVEEMPISVVQKLLAIPRGKRNHPLDAVGVGVYAARHSIEVIMGNVRATPAVRSRKSSTPGGLGQHSVSGARSVPRISGSASTNRLEEP